MMTQNDNLSPNEAAILALAGDLGVLRPRDLRAAGHSTTYLPRLIAKGRLVKLGRGQYALPDREPTEHETLALTAKRYPGTVVCLLSALRFHDLTTQSPGAVWLAIEGAKMAPTAPQTRIQVVRMTGRAYHDGTTTHKLDRVPVRIYDPDKTVVDCFKFRRRVGLDVAIEALRECLRQRRATPAQIWAYAEICRVTTVIRPYLEALA
ncbi:MAG TPA: type IV toxin-antitoxin system AbiEi family antitoxin domain-containing protein [Candidatus Krumholzibacteria bacterium]|nr:type IV toxin-antitoxin system AbiEi family antitoxin domain-containing protein [Candidatus Krumholzibacteria bacterium]